ncbi:MAG: hypothetical protein EZS28_022526 [Streblomastix strix]|uniref:Tyr recombinase domain-containing protein n=1 Tax=Streblomastix strix TaxID=222440 RepID=A0A5J4VHH8_9EUKA|nr:MAG: hypothetical protein EZS28_022526 [Streblomastix strix]
MIAIAHGTWNKRYAKLRSNNREMKAITQGLRSFAKVLTNSRVQSLAIKNDNCTAVFHIKKWRAAISLIKEIKQVQQLIEKLGIQIQITNLLGVKNKIADALSRLSRTGDYKLNEKIFQQTCLQINLNSIIDLFSQHFNNLLPRFMSTIRKHGEIAIDTLNQTRMKEFPWIHLPIPLLPAVLKKIREEQIDAMIIAPLRPGQIWYTELVNENAQSLMLGWSNEILEPGTSLIKKNLKLPPDKICQILAQFTSVNTSASYALQFLNGFSSILSLTFDIDLKNSHMPQFTRKAISAYMIVKPKYEDTSNVGILFDYQRGKGSNRNLTNIELPAEIERISLRHSVICEQNDKVDLRLQPKTKSGLQSRKHPKTKDQTVSSRATFFDWLKRIDNKLDQSIRYNKYGALWWNEDITIPAKRDQISLRLKKLLDLIGINGKPLYSFRHQAATQLEVMGLDETLLNTYTGHAINSKSTNEYYVFIERLKGNEIATKLSDTRGQMECNSIPSTQQR